MAEGKKIIAIRVTEWTEWIPLVPDQATDGQLALGQGVSCCEIQEHEKLVEAKVARQPVPTIKRRVIDGERVLEDGKSTEGVEVEFALYSFQATLASTTDQDELPAPLITTPYAQPSKIATAAALPPNRKGRRAR